jgi:hypothetical protein
MSGAMERVEIDLVEDLRLELRARDRIIDGNEKTIRERELTIARLERALDMARATALQFGDYEAPATVERFLRAELRAWPRARWEQLAALLLRPNG